MDNRANIALDAQLFQSLIREVVKFGLVRLWLIMPSTLVPAQDSLAPLLSWYSLCEKFKTGPSRCVVRLSRVMNSWSDLAAFEDKAYVQGVSLTSVILFC